LPIAPRLGRRALLPRLAALPAALGLAALAIPESVDARKKRRKRRGGNGGGNGGSTPDDQERVLLGLINDYRQTQGRARLSQQGQLDAAAQRHSQDQAANGVTGHRGSDGSMPDERISDAGYDWSAWGENVYWNSNNGAASAAFTWWKTSPSHNANMLSRDFTEIGIGRARSDSGTWCWTTTFGRR
jgi:uncharacterized protein YkwD